MEKTYDSNLLKGTGLINETLILLENYEEGISKENLITKILDYDLLGKATETRAKDIINAVFYRRYMQDDEQVILALKKLRELGASVSDLIQLFMLYTSRSNPILGDFIIDYYYPLEWRGGIEIETESPKAFIREAIKDGRIEKHWSPSTIQKVSEHIIACLIDFKLIDRSKKIIASYISDLVASYICHELHFNQVSDYDIIHHEDWKLFGLEVYDVVGQLERLSLQGHFLFQYSGELAQINWKYPSLLNFISHGVGSEV